MERDRDSAPNQDLPRQPVAGSTRGRVVRAGFWSMALFAAEKLLLLARIVVLAALLSPRQFGLFGIAVLTIFAVQALSRTGFQEALIRDQADIRRDLDVAWSVQLVRGLLLAGLLLALSAPVAHYFGEPGAIGLIQALSLSLILQGATNIGVIYFRRELDFRKEFLYRFSATMADLLVAVAIALALRSAWALVLGWLAGSTTRWIASYRLHPYRPRLRFSRASLRRLWGYGIWLTLTGVLVYIGTRGPGLVVGKLAGAAALGLYQMAHRIPQIAMQEVSAALESVALPAYALVQRETARLKRSYLGIGGLGFALAVPAALGIAVLGRPFTRDFLGTQWLPMIPALLLLTLAELIRAITATGAPLFMAVGAPRLRFYVQGARALVLLLLVYPLTAHGGIAGTAAAMVVAAIAGAIVWSFGMRRTVTLSARELATTLLPPLLAGVLMGAILYPLRVWTEAGIPPVWPARLAWMAGLAALGAAIYAGALWAGLKAAGQSVVLETLKGLYDRHRSTAQDGGRRNSIASG